MQRVQQRSTLYLTVAGVLVFISFLLFEVYFTSQSAWVRMSFGLVSQVIRSGLLIVWCVSIHNRILNKQIRQYLLWVGALMLIWLNVRFIKWDFLHFTDPLGRYIWYAFYIPMLLIPLLGVFIIQCVDKPENYVLPKRMKRLYIPFVFLLVLVFTNDFHELVFVFPNGITNYNFDYGYNFGFYLVCAWFVILGFYFAIMLLLKNRTPGRRSFKKMPIVIMVVAVVFWIFYKKIMTSVDLVAIDCLLITALLESAIQSGLIRSNTGYHELFEISTVAAQIVDEDYQACYISSCADDFPKDIMRRAEQKPVDKGNTVLNSKKISGGRILWQNDLTQIKQLLAQLTETQEQLNENNVLLKAELELKENKARLDEKNRLYDRIASEVYSQLEKAEKLLKLAEENPEKTREILLQICVLSAYIKRRSNLLLLNEENSTIQSKELEYCFYESLKNIELNNVLISFDSICNDMLSVEFAVLAYDLFENIVEAFVENINAVLVHLHCKNGDVRLRIQIGCEIEITEEAIPEFAVEYNEITYDIQEKDIVFDVILSTGGDTDD